MNFHWLTTLARSLTRSPRRIAKRTTRRPNLERLEDRTVLSFTASLSGGTLTFTSTTPGDRLLLFTDANGNLEQNRAKDPGFASGYDMNSSMPGVQGLNISALTNLVINATGAGSSIDLSGLSYSGKASLQATSLIVAGDVNFFLTNTNLTLSNGGDYTLTGVTNVTMTGGPSNDTLDASAFTAGPVTLYSGSGNATLKGGTGGTIFNLGGGTDSVTGLGTNNKIVASGVGQITLTDSALTINGKTSTLSDIQNAVLTGGNSPTTFDVSGWSGNGNLTGTSSNDTVVCDADTTFVLTDNSLQLNDGPTYTLSGIENAKLTSGPGVNTFSVHNWSGSDTLNGSAGNDVYLITLNSSGTGTTTITNGSNTTGSAYIFGPDTPSPITLTATQMTMGSQKVLFSNLSKLTLDGGAGADNIAVQGTALGTTVTVQSGAGNDSITVSSATNTLDTFLGPLTVDGGAGSNTLTVSESGSTTADTINVSGTQITSASRSFSLTYLASNGSYASGLSLYLGSGNDTIDVSGTVAGTSTFIKGGGGNDTFNVSNNGASLTTLAGYLYLDGGAGSDSLTINESGATTADTIGAIPGVIYSTVRPFSVYYGNSGGGNFGAGVNLKLGAGNNVVSVFGTVAGAPTVITAGSGNNSFYVNSLTNTLAGYNGLLYLIAGSGSNSLTVSESGQATADNLVLGPGYMYSFVEPFALYYGSNNGGNFSRAVTFVGGTANDVISDQGTLANAPTYIFTGAANDTVYVGSTANTLATFTSTVFLTGGTGTDSVIVNDSGSTTNDQLSIAATYLASNTSSFALGLSGKFSSITVGMGGGNNAVSVLGESTGTYLTVNSGIGSNTFTVVVASNSGYNGLVINGGPGINSLLIQAPGATTQDFASTTTSGYYEATYGTTGLPSYIGYQGITTLKRLL